MRTGSFALVALLAVAALGCEAEKEASAASLQLARFAQADGEGQAAQSESGSVPAAKAAAPGQPARPLAPLVSLAGESPVGGGKGHGHAGAIPLYTRAARTWVYAGPDENAKKLGYLRAGAVVRSRPGSVVGAGCPGGFRAIEPEGYVCVGSAVTESENDPIGAALSSTPPDPRRKLPYIYGTVRRPGPVYARIPSTKELSLAEPGIEKRMDLWLSTKGEAGAGFAQFVWLGTQGAGGGAPDPAADWHERRNQDVPSFLAAGLNVPNLHRRPREADQLVIDRTRPKVGYSFVRTFVAEGRRYGLTPELEILPTDRLRPIQGSAFHGFEIGRGIDLPVAIVRKEGARYLTYDRKTNTTSRGEVAPYREPLPITGRQQFFRGVLHYETKDGLWLADRDASRIDPAKKLPGWAIKGERWIDVNVTKQTLVLYEGEKPVYATLVSTGEAGLSDAVSTTATPRGIFRIHTKHVATTMASDEVGEEFELRDVPYVQYFDDAGHAIHGAYWHDRFGVPKSHGCINLAPEDARRLFYFTSPSVPESWHGAMEALRGTIIFIHA